MNTAERKIFAAHQKAGSYCSRGDSPTQALVKVANETELNPEMVRRVSEMLNISLTRGFLKSASDKTASFPLADAEAAIREVFAGESASHKTASPVVGADWGGSEGSLKVETIASNHDDHLFFKVARETPRENLDDLVRQAEGARRVLKLELSKCAQDRLASEERAFGLYQRLVGYFTQSAHGPDYADFESGCYGDYGIKVAALLDPIFEHLPETTRRGDAEFAKSAAYFGPTIPGRIFDQLAEEIGATAKIAQSQHNAEAALVDYEQQLGAYYQHALGGPSRTAGSAVEMLDFKKKADLSFQFHNPLEAAVAAHDASTGAAYTKGLDAEREGLYKVPKDEADMEMDNVRRQAILAELMSNDPVITGQHPEHVKSAYETLLHLSPKSTLHREVVRAVLRNATAQQAVDPFTAKQLADLEGQHLKNKALGDGKALPAGTQN
jgi:hypothetical protein